MIAAPKLFGFYYALLIYLGIMLESQCCLRDQPQPLIAFSMTPFIIGWATLIASQSLTTKPNDKLACSIKMVTTLLSNIETSCLRLFERGRTANKNDSNVVGSETIIMISLVCSCWLKDQLSTQRLLNIGILAGSDDIPKTNGSTAQPQTKLDWDVQTKTSTLLVFGLLALGSAIRATSQRTVLMKTPSKRHRVVFVLGTNHFGTFYPTCSLLSSQLQTQLLWRIYNWYSPTIKITESTAWVVFLEIISYPLLHFSQSLCFMVQDPPNQDLKPVKVSRFLVGKNFGIVGWDDWIPCRNPLFSCFVLVMTFLLFGLVMQLSLLSKLSCLKREGLMGWNDNAVPNLTAATFTQLKMMGRNTKLVC
ncbi:hypothetical protein TPPAVE_155 [Candidatus Tremblaya phenacola PAVE]|nr:hypothetical protein TPPAVE_155 [Candidatus Tremblaya phenacola PAVE]